MSSVRSLLLIAAPLCACSPALDWRQMTPQGLGVQAQFPCRPASLTREVRLPHGTTPMVMHACSAAGSTFALASITAGDVRDVASAMDSLREAASRNLGAQPSPAQAFAVPGMTPNDRAGRLTLNGRRPDGSPITEHLLLFAHGLRIFQASVVGDAPSEAAVTTFFGGLKVLQ